MTTMYRGQALAAQANEDYNGDLSEALLRDIEKAIDRPMNQKAVRLVREIGHTQELLMRAAIEGGDLSFGCELLRRQVEELSGL